MKTTEITEININYLFEKIASVIEEARRRASTAINLSEVYAKFNVGRYIVEDEQEGNYKAGYGKQVLKQISKKLGERFGEGWSVDTLERCRKFYTLYSPFAISASPLRKLESIADAAEIRNSVAEIQTNSSEPHKFVLSWSHYLILMRIKDANARSFYEIECAKQNWSIRWLQRQVNSSLYERLALSKDKGEVMRLATEGQVIEKPADIIKNPITLEFLGLKPEAAYSESKLEGKIISKMQQFLLELGKGFLFETRQKRFTFDEENFYVDLVFYNRLLQCYVLIDLKIDKLTHQDLGQMQMYVNYYDRHVRQEWEKPTIGILLCKEKKDALIKLTLPEDANIYATEYALYLPDKNELQERLQQWILEFDKEEDDDL
ncbi:MAG: DUF1016 family protein [Bacteroidales bacterium]|nr:DUF1016 family protein [Bacteroidales bacterium]